MQKVDKLIGDRQSVRLLDVQLLSLMVRALTHASIRPGGPPLRHILAKERLLISRLTHTHMEVLTDVLLGSWFAWLAGLALATLRLFARCTLWRIDGRAAISRHVARRRAILLLFELLDLLLFV